jgi:hypothetical protein
MKKPSENNVTYTLDRFADNSLWDYDPNWGIVNLKLGLKHTRNYECTITTNTQNTKFAERMIDINDYREIKQISAVFSL